jgi:hypothetical protein
MVNSFCFLLINRTFLNSSTGILLWEIFSLGQLPYPEVDDESFFQQLRSGHRMEKPELANKSIFDIMFSCWKVEAELRPSFEMLEDILKLMTNESVRNFFS